MRPICAFRIHLLCIYASINFVLITGQGLYAETFPEKVKRPVSETIAIRQEKQKAEDDWALEREKLTAIYDALALKRENQLATREQLRKDIAFQEANVQSLTRQIEDVSRISEEIAPFLSEIYERLKALIAGGAPFLSAERTSRIEKLRDILEDPGVSMSEKFRKLMEAVQIEADYGNTIEVYPQQITLNGKELQANIFRLGRISLFCQSLDQKMCGYYNTDQGQWEILPNRYNRDINAAMEIGLKRRPVDLVNLPLGRISKK